MCAPVSSLEKMGLSLISAFHPVLSLTTERRHKAHSRGGGKSLANVGEEDCQGKSVAEDLFVDQDGQVRKNTGSDENDLHSLSTIFPLKSFQSCQIRVKELNCRLRPGGKSPSVQ